MKFTSYRACMFATSLVFLGGISAASAADDRVVAPTAPIMTNVSVAGPERPANWSNGDERIYREPHGPSVAYGRKFDRFPAPSASEVTPRT